MFKNPKQLIAIFLAVASVGVLGFSEIVNVKAAPTIKDGLVGKVGYSERANYKAQEIFARHSGELVGVFAKSGITLEVRSMRKINNGLEIVARAWNGGQKVGFGSDGSVEWERFQIINPPLMVTDGTFHNETLSAPGGRTEVVAMPNFKEDPIEALQGTLAHIVKNHGTAGSQNIVLGKVGNTTSTFYPDASRSDGAVNEAADALWATARGALTGDSVSNTDAAYNIFTYGDTSPRFDITRGFFHFLTGDTIGTDQQIDSATLSLAAVNKVNADNDGLDYMVVTATNVTDVTTIATADYDQVKGDDGNFPLGALVAMQEQSDQIDLGVIVADSSTYNVFTLNATGRGNIAKGAGEVTRLGLAEGHDATNNAIDNTAANENRMRVMFFESTGSGQDPLLTVTHSTAVVAAVSGIADIFLSLGVEF